MVWAALDVGPISNARPTILPPFFLLQGIPADVEHLLDGAMSLKTPPQHFLRPHPRESTEGAREPSPMDLLAPLTGAPARAGAMTPGSALPQPHGVSDRARGTPLCTPVRRLGQSSASGPSPWCRIGAGRGGKRGGMVWVRSTMGRRGQSVPLVPCADAEDAALSASFPSPPEVFDPLGGLAGSREVSIAGLFSSPGSQARGWERKRARASRGLKARQSAVVRGLRWSLASRGWLFGEPSLQHPCPCPPTSNPLAL